jgi:hypothetical protein
MPWLIALGVCGAVVLAGAAVIAQRRAIAHALIDGRLRARGVEEVAHVVERFGFAELRVRDLRIGSEGDLVVERIDARYSLSSLMARHLDELSVRGVRLRGTFDEGGVSFGALDPLLASGADAGRSPPTGGGLPAANIAIEDVEIELETPRGALAASFEARVRDVGGGNFEASAELAVQHPLGNGAAGLDLRGKRAAFEGDAVLELTAAGAIAPGAELEPAALALAASFIRADGRIEVTIDPAPVAIAVRREDATLRAEGETPALSLSAPAAGGDRVVGLRVTTSGGRLRLPDFDFEVRDIAVDADLDPETGLPSGSLQIAALVDTRAPPRLPELTLGGTFEAIGAEVGFDVTAADPGGHLELGVRGTHDAATGSGEARVEMKRVEFEAEGLQPAALSPLLGRSIETAKGNVEARGAIAWGGDEAFRGGLDLAMRDLSVSLEQGSFERLNAAIHVDGPWPLSTPPNQLVSMARADFGLALTNGLIAFQIHPNGVLDLESAEWTFAGGTIHTRGATDLAAETQELTLNLADIDLSELLALVDLEGLSGSGRLEGRIPVVRRGSTLEIRNGKLSGTKEGGWIRYRAASGIANVASQQPGFDVALAALENFQYDELVATVNGDAAGPVNISVRLIGQNPDRFEDRPVDFTLDLEAHLVDLLQKATAVYRIPAEIEERLREMSEESS